LSGRVIVVGSVNVDLVVTGERLPAPGETVTGGRFERFHGGKGGNQAVAAARLGAETWFVGAVGDDAFGAEARAALEAEGVRTEGLTMLADEATGIALILVDGRGENLISVAGGANLALSPEHVRAALDAIAPGDGDIVLVGHEIRTEAAREALWLARHGGAATVFNPAPVSDLDRRTFSLADHLTPNRGELTALVANDARSSGPPPAGADDPAVASARLIEATAAGSGVGSSVLVSLGAAGALLVERGRAPRSLPAAAVAAVDTVGAGDTLNGALAAGLAAGLPLEEAARRAVLAASLAVTRPGARAGMPSLGELERALATGA